MSKTLGMSCIFRIRVFGVNLFADFLNARSFCSLEVLCISRAGTRKA